ncbi:MAG: CHAT domain-containing protein [Saprospiraceae bacterium]|jgi:CHAT domain-containing protein
MKIRHLFFCLLFLTFSTNNLSAQLESIYEDANNAVSKNRYTDAFALYKKAYNLAQETADTSSLLCGKITGALAYEYYYADDEAQGRKLISQALVIKKRHLAENDLELGMAYYETGHIYVTDPAHSIKAKKYSEKAIEIFRKQANLSPKIANAYMHIGVYYEEGDDLRKAFSNYQKALELAEQFPKEKKVMINLNLNLGNLNLKRDDSQKALIYYEKALDLSLEVNGDDHFKTNDILLNLAIIKTRHKEFDAAFIIYDRILQSNMRLFGEQSDGVASVYENIGSTYSVMKDNEKALIYLEKSEKIYLTIIDKNSPQMAGVQLHLGQSFTRVGEFEKGLACYQKTQKIAEKVFGPEHILNAAAHYYSASVLVSMERFEEAMERYELAKKGLRYDPNDLQKMNSTSKAADLHFNLGFAFCKWYDKTNNIEYSQKADEAYEVALQLMETARNGFSEKESGDYLMRKYRISFQNVLLNKWGLWQQTKDERYVDDMFTLIDKVKNSELKDGILQNAAIRFANIPVDLIAKESSLKLEISDLQDEIYQLGKQDTLSLITERKVNLNEKKADYKNLLQRFENEFPSYYNLRHNHEAFTIEKTQKNLLEDKEALINFFVEESFIFAVLVHKNGFIADSIAIDEDFATQIFDLKNALTDIHHPKKYRQISHDLYLKVMQRSVQQIPVGIKDLIIIPEGELGYIPFEILVTEAPKDNNLKYLGDRYNISYAYSAALLAEQRKLKPSNPKIFAGFAPDYTQNERIAQDTFSDNLLAQVVRNGDFPLPGAQSEIAKITELLGGDSYINAAGNEANFKTHAADYRILHLSMHALLDEKDPLQSRLIFGTTTTDSLEDNYLYASELYNLSLNSDMVVLSACNTGTGQYKKGEGIMSLSRSFAYSGVPACVMSLWKVPDDATSQIMIAFYENLTAGMKKDAALQAAKKTYRENVLDERLAHPFYWAGFVVTGDAGKLSFLESLPMEYWILIAGGFFCILFFGYYYLKK